jgi:hypothetical protein
MKATLMTMVACGMMLCGCRVDVGDTDVHDCLYSPYEQGRVVITQSVVIAVWKNKWVQYCSYVNTGEVITNTTNATNWILKRYPECWDDGLDNYKGRKIKNVLYYPDPRLVPIER